MRSAISFTSLMISYAELKSFSLIVFLALLSGCSIEAEVFSGNAVIQNGSLSSFSVTSGQNIRTTGFAKVKATGGAMTYGSVLERTPNGVTVYHHIQGAILANEVKPGLSQGNH